MPDTLPCSVHRQRERTVAIEHRPAAHKKCITPNAILPKFPSFFYIFEPLKTQDMKKIFALVIAMCGFAFANAQAFTGTYTFASVTTTSGTTDPTPPPTATGLTFGSFTAVGPHSPNPNANGRFSFVNWPTGARSEEHTSELQSHSFIS